MQTETQGKLFIVAGSLGLLISAYFLVSAFFPSTPTPNNTATTTDTQETQDSLPNTGTDNIDFTQMLLEGQGKKTLDILIPEFLFTAGFETIAKKIKDDIGFDIIFHKPSDLKDIQQRSDKWTYNDEDIDIALVPTDIIQSLIPYSKQIPIAEELSPYYHEAFLTLLDNQNYTFIPHSIDPLVIFAKQGTTYPSNAQERLDVIIARESPKRGHFPVLFGLSTQDRHFIKQNREVIEDHFLILYHLIQQASQTADPINEVRTLLDIPNISRPETRNVADFISTTNRLQEQNRHCKSHPSICLFNYDFGDSRFGLLSDIHKIEKYFSIRDYQVHPFWYTQSYPARGRGFLINKNTQSNTRVLYFLENYIQASLIEVNNSLRDRTIAASTIANSAINDPATQGGLYSNENNWDMLISNKGFFTDFDNKTNFIQTREGLQTPELFIEKIRN